MPEAEVTVAKSKFDTIFTKSCRYLALCDDGAALLETARRLDLRIESSDSPGGLAPVASLPTPAALYDRRAKIIQIRPRGLALDVCFAAHELGHAAQDEVGLLDLLERLPAWEFALGTLVTEADATARQAQVAVALARSGHQLPYLQMRATKVTVDAVDAFVATAAKGGSEAESVTAAFLAVAAHHDFHRAYLAIAAADFVPVPTAERASVSDVIAGVASLGRVPYEAEGFREAVASMRVAASRTVGLMQARFPDPDEPRALEMARMRYMAGSCLVFAVALSRRTGWPLAVLRDADDDDLPVHVLCAAPDGRLADVRGLQAEEAAREGVENGDELWLDRAADEATLVADDRLDPFSRGDVAQATLMLDALLDQDADLFDTSGRTSCRMPTA